MLSGLLTLNGLCAEVVLRMAAFIFMRIFPSFYMAYTPRSRRGFF
jgi:hypothetical protein